MAAKFPGPSATSTPMPKPREEAPRSQTQPPRRQLIEPTSDVEEEEVQPMSVERDAYVSQAVSNAVSTILPGSDTMTTFNETGPGSDRSGEAVSQTPSVTNEGQRDGRGQMEETLKSTLKSDTMFGDEPSKESDAESIEEEITEEMSPEPSQRGTLRDEELPPKQETEGEESETPPVESDSEGLVMAPRPSKRKQKPETKPGNSVTIAVNHVSLEEESGAMNNNNIKQLFIEYKFLGIDPQETETPFSLPKPKPYHNIQFNFSKTFHVDFENNYQRRQYLASMLLPSDPDDGRIRFTLVSEPPEDDQDGDCEDVGVAFVSIRDILKTRKDIVDQDIEILDIQDEETAIGSMNVTVACLSALESVEKEMKVEGTY